MKKVVIYSKEDCPFCLRAKSVLKSKGLEIDEVVYDGVNVTKSDVAKVIGREQGESEKITFPQIFIDGEYVGGYTDLCVKFGIPVSR